MLYPIKIDASATDGSVRLIDTLILDTTSLPIPPWSSSSSPSTKTILEETIHKNALFLTTTLLSDMECYGITRINKTYIGRVKLWDAAPLLYEQVLVQITNQLELLLNTEWNGDKIAYRNTTTDNNSKVQDDDNDHEEEEEEGKPRQTTDSTTDGMSSNILSSSSSSSSDMNKKNKDLIHIHLRLRDTNTYLVDDFYIDPRSTILSNPFLIASTIVHDLHLKSEVWIQSIVVSILEQIYGLQIDDTIQGLPKVQVRNITANNTQSITPMEITKDMTATWMIRTKEENTLRDMVVDQYRIHNSK